MLNTLIYFLEMLSPFILMALTAFITKKILEKKWKIAMWRMNELDECITDQLSSLYIKVDQISSRVHNLSQQVEALDMDLVIVETRLEERAPYRPVSHSIVPSVSPSGKRLGRPPKLKE